MYSTKSLPMGSLEPPSFIEAALTCCLHQENEIEPEEIFPLEQNLIECLEQENVRLKLFKKKSNIPRQSATILVLGN